MRSPISYYDSRTRDRAPVRARRRWTHPRGLRRETGDVLELGRITMWEPGVAAAVAQLGRRCRGRRALRPDRRPAPTCRCTRACCPAADEHVTGSFSFVRVGPRLVREVVRAGATTASRETARPRAPEPRVLYYRNPSPRRAGSPTRSGSTARCSPTTTTTTVVDRVPRRQRRADRCSGSRATRRRRAASRTCRGSTSTTSTRTSTHATRTGRDDRRADPPVRLPRVRRRGPRGHRWTFAQARPTMECRDHAGCAPATSGSSSRCCRKAAPALAARVVGHPARCAARSRRCSRSRWACSSARCEDGDSLGGAARVHGRRVRRCCRCSSPIHQAVSANLGSRTAAWLNDRLMRACVRPPGHGAPRAPGARERPHDGARLRPRHHRSAARDRAWTSSRSASSTWSAASRRRSCSPATRGGRRSCSAARGRATHWLLRESSVWRDRNTDEVRDAQRHADYAYRLAVDPPAAKELRLFGLSDWTVERFATPAPAPVRAAVARHAAARAVGASEPGARARARTALVFWSLADAAASGEHHASAQLVVFATAAVGTSSIAFGGLELGARRRVAAGRPRRCDSSASMAPIGALPVGHASAAGLPGARDPRARPHVRVRGRRPPGARRPRPHDPGRHLARDRRPERRGQDDARQAAVPPLRPAARRDRGRRHRSPRARPRRVARRASPPCSRTSSATSCRCATTSRRTARPTTTSAPRCARPARPTSPISTRSWRVATPAAPTSRAGSGSASRSPARLCAVRLGAGVVLLDEPTAQLDVRGEAEIFDRILAATRDCTTILDLAPVLDRAPRRPHLRARRRHGRRARLARRAHGARTGATARCSTSRRRASATRSRRGGVV